MCLYPKFIRNPKYLPNKKNGGNPPQPLDERLRWIEAPCGCCFECCKQRANSWKFRLEQEIRNNKLNNKKCLFVTLTFKEESLQELERAAKEKENSTEGVNGIAKIAVKKFRERWRRKHAKSPKHWLVTELGGENGRIHLHGILFEDTDQEELSKLWAYGFVYIGTYVNEKTIAYIVKYLFKQSEVDRMYRPIVLTSPGIGKTFFKSYDCQAMDIDNTKVRLKTGVKMEAPTYYKERQLTDKQREIIHLKNITKQEIWIDGVKYNRTPSSAKAINEARHQAMERYEKLGYLSENEILTIRREKKRKKK